MKHVSKVLHFKVILQKIREENLFFCETAVRLMQGVCLIWGPLNIGFTVFESRGQISRINILFINIYPEAT